MLNLSFSIIFICEFVFKIYGMGFFAYWADPANAFDGILVGLIIGEFVLQAATESGGSSITSNLRTVRLFRVLKVFRALRCCRLIVGTQGNFASGSVNSLLRRKNQVQPTSPEEEIDRELEMERGIDKTEGEAQTEGEAPTAPVPDEDPKEKDNKDGGDDDEEDDDDEPTDPFEVPESFLGKVYWGVTLPMCLIFHFTIPDKRKPLWSKCCAKWFFVTFIMSIVWIGALSFFLIWMAESFGHSMGIPSTIMGLTILAAVALVVLSIHISNWFLTKKIGYFLFCTYIAFATATILTEYGYILSSC